MLSWPSLPSMSTASPRGASAAPAGGSVGNSSRLLRSRTPARIATSARTSKITNLSTAREWLTNSEYISKEDPVNPLTLAGALFQVAEMKGSWPENARDAIWAVAFLPREEELKKIGTDVVASVSEAIMASVTGLVSKLGEVYSQVDSIGTAMTTVVDTVTGVQKKAMAIAEEAEQGAHASYATVASSQTIPATAEHTVAMERTRSQESQIYVDTQGDTDSEALSRLEEGVLLQKATMALELMTLEEGETQPEGICFQAVTKLHNRGGSLSPG